MVVLSHILRTMFDATLIKDLTELMGKSLNFKDIEAIGGYLFKSRGV